MNYSVLHSIIFDIWCLISFCFICRFWSWQETLQKIWRWSVSLLAIYSWPSVETRSWTPSSRPPSLVEVCRSLISLCSLQTHCRVDGWRCEALVFAVFSQVWFLTSISPWSVRRASRRPCSSRWDRCGLKDLCLGCDQIGLCSFIHAFVFCFVF